MEWENALVVAHMAATWTMVGVIWFVQLVHYPMFRLQPGETFVAFAEEHQRRTSWVVVPPMLVELATALLILVGSFTAGAAESTRFLAVVGLGLLLAVWASTFLLQAPCHRRLLEGKDEATLRRLVATNWLRTAGWTARGGIAIVLLVTALAG